jgi:hypothetical protein
MSYLQDGSAKGFAPYLFESKKGMYFLGIACLGVGYVALFTCVVLCERSSHALVWDGLFWVLMGLFFLLRFGLTKEPLYFYNQLTFREKTVSVLAARLTYIPSGLCIIYIGLKILISALK